LPVRAVAVTSRENNDRPCEIETPVETVLILTKVTVRIFLKVEGMVSPIYCGLQVAKDGVDPSKTLHLATLAFADNVLLMDTTSFSYRRKTG